MLTFLIWALKHFKPSMNELSKCVKAYIWIFVTVFRPFMVFLFLMLDLQILYCCDFDFDI